MTDNCDWEVRMGVEVFFNEEEEVEVGGQMGNGQPVFLQSVFL